jgi:hypothetical protein
VCVHRWLRSQRLGPETLTWAQTLNAAARIESLSSRVTKGGITGSCDVLMFAALDEVRDVTWT